MSESQPPPLDPEDFIRRIGEGFRNVRLGQGVVGKTSRIMLAVIGLWAIIVWKLGPNPWLDAALFVSGAVGTGLFVWWTRSTQRFAAKNPAQAMLEGAHLLEYQRFQAAVKGQLPGKSDNRPGELK